jgi:nickel/cobalt exporter
VLTGPLIERSFKHLWLRATLLALLAAILPLPLLAHPLGNFSTNRYSHLDIGSHQVDIFYVIDMAEIPTHRARLEMDMDGDKIISVDESNRYGASLATVIEDGLGLTVDGNRLPLLLQEQTLAFQPGQAGLETLRLEFTFAAALPTARGERFLHYIDRTMDGQIGWQELIVTVADNVELVASDAPAVDISNVLRTYPVDLLQSPLATRSANVTFAVEGEGNWLQAMVPVVISPPAEIGSGDRSAADPFAELIAIPELGAWAMFLALLGAFGWGAVHAMSPGHGKTIVGAYLVGSRGTVPHAMFLGLTTTITHTLGVFGLGVVALTASQFFRPEQLYPWLGTLSGLIVAAIGFDRLLDWWRGSNVHNHARDHTHDHTEHSHRHDVHNGHIHDAHEDPMHLHDAYSHDHGDGHVHSHLPPGADGAPVSWRSLLALGVSGGLLPCPSALVVMLGAIALGRITFGLLLITVFSLGLACVLTTIGIALVHAGKLFERIPEHVQVTRWLPVASALFITGAGLVIALRALVSTGLFSL